MRLADIGTSRTTQAHRRHVGIAPRYVTQQMCDGTSHSQHVQGMHIRSTATVECMHKQSVDASTKTACHSDAARENETT